VQAGAHRRVVPQPWKTTVKSFVEATHFSLAFPRELS
jgi:hypothetical protein